MTGILSLVRQAGSFLFTASLAICASMDLTTASTPAAGLAAGLAAALAESMGAGASWARDWAAHASATAQARVTRAGTRRRMRIPPRRDGFGDHRARARTVP